MAKRRRFEDVAAEIEAELGGGARTFDDISAEIEAELAKKPEPPLSSRIQSGLESVITPALKAGAATAKQVYRATLGPAADVVTPERAIQAGLGAMDVAYRPFSALGAWGAGKLAGEPEAITAMKVGREIVGGEGAKGSGFAPAAKQVLDAAVEYGVTKGLLGDKNIIDQAVKEGKPLRITVPKGIPYAGGKTVDIPPEYLLSIPAELAVPADFGLSKALKALKAGKAAKAISTAEHIVPEEIIQREGSLAKAIETPVEAPKAPPVSGAAQPPIVPETPVVRGVEARGGEAGKAAGAAEIPPVTAQAGPPPSPSGKVPPAVESAEKYIRFGGPKRQLASVNDTVHKWWNNIYNDLHQWRRFEEPAAKAQGIREGERGYTMARISRGWPGIAEEWLKKGGPSSWTEPDRILDIPSLDQIIKNSGVSTKEFSTWYTAVHSGEWEMYGLNTGIPMQEAAKWVNELTTPQIQKAADQFNQFMDAARQFLVDTGVLKAEARDAMEAKYMFYVPFQRVIEESGEGMKFFEKFADLPSAVKHAVGSERQIIDPLESAYKNIAMYINLGTKNAAASKLVDILEAAPRGADLIEKIAPNVAAPAGKATATILRDGVRTKFAVDPRLYSSLEKLDRGELDMGWKILSAPASLQRMGITLGPEFPGRNIVRDIPNAIIQTAMRPQDVVQGVAAMIDDAVKGSGGSNKTMRFWRLSGGQHAFQASIDRSNKAIAKSLSSLTDKAGPFGMVVKAVKHPLDAWREVAGVGEAPARVGAFIRQGKRLGGATDRASLFERGLVSREAGVDFQVRGAKMRGLTAARAFLGATIGSQRQLVKTFVEHPVRTNILGVAGLTVPTTMLYLAQRNDGRYADVPEFYKDTGLVVLPGFVSKEDWGKMTPEQKAEYNKSRPVVWIPTPHAYAVIYSAMPRRFLEYIDNSQPEILDEYWRLLNMAGIDNPLPTVAQVAWDVGTNKSSFSGKPVEPQALHELTPTSERYTEWTTPLGFALNKLTGGVVSPAQADYILQQFGGVGKAVQDVSSALGGKSDKVEKRWTERPGARAFFVRTPSSLMQSTADLQKANREAQNKSNVFHAVARRGEPRTPERIGGTIRDIESDAGRLAAITKKNTALYDQMRDVRSDATLTPEQKRAKIDALYYEMADNARKELDRRKELQNAPR